MLRIARRLAGLCLFASLALAVSALAGIRVQPMAYDLTPSGSGAQRDLRVENTGDSPTPVELTVERRQILPDGSEKRTPAEDDFLIFPPQGIIPAHGFQTFRVQYIGPIVDKTVLYVVTVAQLPVDVNSGQNTGVQFLLNLGTLAAVSPPHSEAKLVVANVRPSATANMLTITVRNDGDRYARLRSGQWKFSSRDGRHVTLEGEALAKALQQPLIEPGTTRIIDLPVPADFDRTGANAAFTLAE